MNNENFFIRTIARNAFMGDDGAVLPDGTVASADAFFEEVHFRRSWMNLDQIATKAMLVNISDQIAMNAKPLYALLCVAMPNLSAEEMGALAHGFQKTAKKYGITIIGGDTIQNSKLDITVTLLGHTDAPLMRKGLKKGDLLFYTGKLGTVKRDLDILLNGGTIPESSHFIHPKLRPEFVAKAAPHLHAALDISDGLFSELERLSEVNGCGFALDKPIPKEIGCSGEEYEILLGCAPEEAPSILAAAKATRTPLTFVGTVTKGSFTNPCPSHHFA